MKKVISFLLIFPFLIYQATFLQDEVGITGFLGFQTTRQTNGASTNNKNIEQGVLHHTHLGYKQNAAIVFKTSA